MPLLALGAWFVGLLPWIVTRSSTHTFGSPWNPRNDLRTALLPFHHQQLMTLLVVTVVAGALAGSAPWWSRDRLRRRWLLALLATLGAAAATGWAVTQTLAPEPDLGGSGATADTVRLAFVALTVAGSLLGLLLGLGASLGGPVLRTVAATPLVVVGADWLGQLVVVALADPARPQPLTWLPPTLTVLTGVGVGVLLAVLGFRPVWRLVGWVLALALLVLTPSVLTATRYVLESLRGTAVRSAELAELAHDGLEVFRLSLTSTATAFGPATPTTTALIAVVVGAIGAVLLRRVRG
ncbi:hypothetical protein [Intrasporangium sp. YIM S08009]|uniref:hypothetical protein n=1 Tax=Intrasporangium zincisolvens TaxID=3080018 RepID=UPI002B05EFCB|nr:hypothetical protein [Intrasporangium sp. YIM S08009]